MAWSPRFKLRKKEISAVINKSRMKHTWKNKVRTALRDQFLPDPVDFYDYQLDINRICESIENIVFAGTYVPRPPRRMTQEKSKGLCRLLTVPHPTDILVLQCLSDALYSDIKNKQPTNKAFFEPEDHSFSGRDTLFGTPQYGSYKSWLDFQKEILKFTQQREWIIVTDIANYYDFINYTHLRNVIAGTIQIRESILDFLIFLLSSLLWQPDYTPRFEVGLPQINADAPRILAHCFLFELDKIIDDTRFDYARFMDDIDIGVDSEWQAKNILKEIDLVLQTRQVRLNSGKTKILSRTEAEKHFKKRENMFLDRFVARINSRHQNRQSLQKDQKFTEYCFEYGFKNKTFKDGNGDKILKRLITIAGKIKAKIPPATIAMVLKDWPSVRENILIYHAQMPHSKAEFEAITNFIHRKEHVDDFSWICFAATLVSARLPRAAYVVDGISKIFRADEKLDFFQLYSKLWILSKYGNADDLLGLLRTNFDVWAADETLGRLVGGLSPIFAQDGMYASFETLLDSAQNKAANDLANFHRMMRNEPAKYASVKHYLIQENPSLPNRIRHAKFLMLLSVLQGYSISEEERELLFKKHHRAFGDGFYATRLTNLL
jgi:hypothetical protein